MPLMSSGFAVSLVILLVLMIAEGLRERRHPKRFSVRAWIAFAIVLIPMITVICTLGS